MASPSKEEQILKLILENSPLKHWHFEEFVKKTGMARASVNKWLKRYQKQGLIRRVKEKNKFPYFVVGENNTYYKSKKRFYMISKLYQSGLIEHLLKLKEARTVILFGSIAKGDWYFDSDIDIFIYGSSKGLETHRYELTLHRDIELHVFKNKDEVKQVKSGLIKNIINGYIVKGNIMDFAEVS